MLQRKPPPKGVNAGLGFEFKEKCPPLTDLDDGRKVEIVRRAIVKRRGVVADVAIEKAGEYRLWGQRSQGKKGEVRVDARLVV